MDPFRLRVLKALTDVIKGVDPAKGFEHDLSAAVFRGRSVFGEGDPLPMVSILESPIPLEEIPSPTGSEARAGGWDLVIQGFVKDDLENPTDPAHLLMAEVKKVLVVEKMKERDGGVLGFDEIRTLSIGPGVVRPPDELSSQAFFWLTLNIDMVEDMRDPYA